jgi:hypothetical protein
MQLEASRGWPWSWEVRRVIFQMDAGSKAAIEHLEAAEEMQTSGEKSARDVRDGG